MSAVHLVWLLGVLGTALGAIAGSFIATLLLRWPKGEKAVAGRSRCDSCGARLKSRDLVPLLSYLALKGRCRQCGSRIDPLHFAIELAAAAIGLVAILAHPFPLALVTAAFGWWLLLVAALDLDHHWLPDGLTLPLLPLGLLAAWLSFGPALEERAAGAAIGWGVLVLIAWLYRRLRKRDGMGGGDPKLLGGVGAWVGAFHLPYILLGAGLVGLAAVAMMRLRGERVTATSKLPLGSLLAVTAWPVWIVAASQNVQPPSI